MLGMFRKKEPSYHDEMERAVRSTIRTLRDADRLLGVEKVMRVASALGSWSVALRSVRPDIPLEEDGVVMTVFRASDSPEQFRTAFVAVDYAIGRAKEASDDVYMLAALLHHFMAPKHFENQVRTLEREAHSNLREVDQLAMDPRLR